VIETILDVLIGLKCEQPVGYIIVSTGISFMIIEALLCFILYRQNKDWSYGSIANLDGKNQGNKISKSSHHEVDPAVTFRSSLPLSIIRDELSWNHYIS